MFACAASFACLHEVASDALTCLNLQRSLGAVASRISRFGERSEYEADRLAAVPRRKSTSAKNEDNKKRPEGRFSWKHLKHHFLPLPSSL